MELRAIDALSGLRAALEAPEERRLAVFGERVMEPLRPLWEPFLAWMPKAARVDAADPALAAARTFSYYTPELDVAAGLGALDRLAEAGSWASCVGAMERAWVALVPEGQGIAIPEVVFSLVLGDPAKLDARMGSYTGAGGQPGRVIVLVWPTDFNLPRLGAIVAHELHHNVRFSFEPFIPHEVTVGQYIVAEGLAEAFAAEQHGEELLGPWVGVLSDEQAAAVTPRFRDALDVRGFNEVRGYIFGDWAATLFGYPPQGVPDFAGYAMGYRVVRAFLARTGTSAAAATYLPWREIVEGSGYF
jgi:uncharacterized protein YjaZ